MTLQFLIVVFEVSSQVRVLLRLFRNPLSGWNSVTPISGPTSGTDAPMRLSGRHRLATEWFGSAQGMRFVGSGSGTGSPVPPVTLSLLCLLSEELHRQPRAVYKYWAPCRLYFPLRPLVSGGHLFAVLVRQWIHDVSLPRLLWWSFLYSAQCLVRQ